MPTIAPIVYASRLRNGADDARPRLRGLPTWMDLVDKSQYPADGQWIIPWLCTAALVTVVVAGALVLA